MYITIFFAQDNFNLVILPFNTSLVILSISWYTVFGDFMTKIYIVRHCEALGNVKRIFQGTTDLDISELGEKQLPYLEKRFSEIPLDRVYSSPLIRTQKTAKAIIGNKGLTLDLNSGLIELDGGIVEGKPFAEALQTTGLTDTWNNHPQDFAPENGEPMRHAYERIWETILKIAKENKGKNVACATHGGVTRCLNCRLLFGDISKLSDTPWSENTAVTLIEFDDDLNPTLRFMNDNSHLPPELVNAKSRVFAVGEKQ